MARKKGSGKPKGKKTGRRTASSVLPGRLDALSKRIHEQGRELRELRHLVREGVLASEMVRLRGEDSHKIANYTQLRRQALGFLILTEGLVEKLGLQIDLRTDFADKYTLGDSTALCGELSGVCRVACCREKFPLTPQDIVEGVVEFDLDDPYIIKMSPSGYCVHFDQGSMKCRIWEQRPARCRLYTCRWDRGVWKDYMKRVPSHKIAELVAQKDRAPAEDETTVAMKGKPGIMLDPSTFHVFQRAGDRLLYDARRD